jgi:uncharacterized protein (TIGR03435 family)
MSAVRLFVAAAIAAAALLAQPKPARLEFEVASIKPSPAQIPNQAAAGLHVDGAQIRCAYLPLREYLAIGHRVRPGQIVGPDWMATERFDISAKLPEGAKPDQIPEMLQALLEDRFKMKTRRESKEFAVYGLVAAKGGLKIKPLPPDPAADASDSFAVKASGGPAGVSVTFGAGSFSLGNNKLQVSKLTMADLAEMLTRFTDRQVVNMTEAEGRYDFAIDLAQEDYMALLIRSAMNNGVTLPPEATRLVEGVSGESSFLALQKVGLKIESRKAPLDVLVVDSVARTPTEN